MSVLLNQGGLIIHLSLNALMVSFKLPHHCLKSTFCHIKVDHAYIQVVKPVCVCLQAEWEALEIVTHEWSLENVEHEMMEEFVPADIDVIAKDKYV